MSKRYYECDEYELSLYDDAKALVKDNEEYLKQKQREVDNLFEGYKQGDPWSEKMVLYGMRCAHLITDPSPKTLMVAQKYQDEIYKRPMFRNEKFLKERHQRAMLANQSNADGDPWRARLQNEGGLARRSSKWVWTPDRVYDKLLKEYGKDYARHWAESYFKTKAEADKNGWKVEVHPSGSIITHKVKED